MDFREYVKLTMVPIERDLAGTRNALEKLAVGMVSTQVIEQLKLQVAGLSEAIQEMDKRLENLERDAQIYRWLFRVSSGLLIGALTLWLYRLLGL